MADDYHYHNKGTMMPTTIKLALGGVPVDYDPESGVDLRQLAQIVKDARAAGFEGQPLRLGGGGWNGGKGREPRNLAELVTVDPKGRVCCKAHGGPLRHFTQTKGEPFHGCTHKDDTGAWCKTKLSEAEHAQAVQQFAPKAAEPPGIPVRTTRGEGGISRHSSAGNSEAPATAEEAEQRFYNRYGPVVGGRSWQSVQRYLGRLVPKPAIVEEWIAIAEEVRDRSRTAA